jgi:hypothetical protein
LRPTGRPWGPPFRAPGAQGVIPYNHTMNLGKKQPKNDPKSPSQIGRGFRVCVCVCFAKGVGEG